MKYNLITDTDKHMTRPRFGLPRGKHFYPSEGSATWKDTHGIQRVAGSCLRQSWYRLSGQSPAGQPDAYTQWIFALGKHVEEILVEQWKQMGIWVANNIKFKDAERNISGELDVVLTEPDGTLFGVEVKSFYGYQATKMICGNKSTKPAPKTSQLMQCLIYVDLCKKLGLIDYFKMVYYARDSAARNEFDITLVDDEGQKRPAINGVIDYRFTMNDIYQRYEELNLYLLSKEPPPRDFDIAWNKEKVEERKKLGEVAKTTYEKWSKKPLQYPIGDWQCRYCNFSDTCYKKHK